MVSSVSMSFAVGGQGGGLWCGTGTGIADVTGDIAAAEGSTDTRPIPLG